jgi:hypothetical protein
VEVRRAWVIWTREGGTKGETQEEEMGMGDKSKVEEGCGG